MLLSVVKGTGTVSGASGESSVSPGDVVAYDAGELHGMKAGTEQLVIAAIITPRPGAR